MAHVSKITSERNQRTLLELTALPGNDICADCKAKHPRWASYSLGIFICMTCASIHRKIGTHITKVKSLTMDSWSREQVEQMKDMGNIKSNAIYNPNELRHPPPPNMIDSERDSDLEKYIRSKYEFKSFFDKKALVASKLGPSRSATNRLSAALPDSAAPQPSARPSSVAVSTPASLSSTQSTSSIPAAAPAPTNPALAAVRTPVRSVSVPVVGQYPTQQTPQASQPQVPTNNATWNDLVSLQAPSANASLPLQYTSASLNTPTASTSLPAFNTGVSVPTQRYKSVR
ncbi:hypothetical protein QCA50_013114 [Cerrena zonata]|uniref:Arf-GAP domain-containing protein n=1 Tax=Cerrena zonata TaxID=2478898 RepID=A0AAW0FPX6_9APHY